MVVPPENTTLAKNFLRMSTSHCMREVSWTPLASLLVKLGWKNTFTQWKRLAADSDEVSVWELKGLLIVGIRCRLELCVVNRTKAAQFLFHLTSNLPLCGGSGAMQSVNFVDGHCVRRTTLPRNGNDLRDSDDVFVWEH